MDDLPNGIANMIQSLYTLAATGQAAAALEMAATAYIHPLSAQTSVVDKQTVRAHAEAVRDAVAGQLEPEVAAAAWERGLAADFDSVVAEIIDSVSSPKAAISA